MQAGAMNNALPDSAASSDCGEFGCAPRRQISAIIHDCPIEPRKARAKSAHSTPGREQTR
jgi:hypothetical protein